MRELMLKIDGLLVLIDLAMHKSGPALKDMPGDIGELQRTFRGAFKQVRDAQLAVMTRIVELEDRIEKLEMKPMGSTGPIWNGARPSIPVIGGHRR
jgi:hypothetical protein